MKKKILSIMLVLSMLVGMMAIMPITASAAELSGAGTASNPYLITSVDDWNYFAENMTKYSTANVKVTADVLDFGGTAPTQIKGFSGTLDGNGVVIKNVKMSGSGDIGLICTSSGIYKNFAITDSSFSVDKQWVGSLMCCTNEATTISGIYVSDTVTVTSKNASGNNAYAGGILGGFGKKDIKYTVTIKDCLAEGKVEAPNNAKACGGIVGGTQGANHTVDIRNCIVTGPVKTEQGPACGFTGKTESSPVSFTNCIYAGGAEEDYYWSYPFSQKVGSITVTNCYTLYANDSGNVYLAADGTAVKYTDENSGVTLVNIMDLVGEDAAVTISGYTKRANDLMLPTALIAGLGDALPSNSDKYTSKYTVTWVNEDGTVLATEEYDAGQTPEYKGETPTKADDDKYTYTFSGWSPVVAPIMSDTTYTAVFFSTRKGVVAEDKTKDEAETKAPATTTAAADTTATTAATEEKSGCGSIIGGGAVALVAILGIGAVSFKKKED